MKKILNDPDLFVPEMLDGLLKAHPKMLSFAANDSHCIIRKHTPVIDKVALVTGGGSGHLPIFLGYVGCGLLDGCAVGDVFAAPSSRQILDVSRCILCGYGVLYIFVNY